MLDKDTILKVTNRDNGSVGYTIPDLGNLHREFTAGETKEVTMDEMRKLSYIPGGKTILKNYLLIDNEEAVKELLSKVEPEYYYKEEDVKKLLLQGSVDEIKDCIDYAPTGTVDLLKKLAVDLEINDIRKRDAIKEMTGFDVTSAITINQETREDKETESKERRIIKPTQKEEFIIPQGRRVSSENRIIK